MVCTFVHRKWFARGLVVATLVFLYLSSIAYHRYCC